MKLFAISSFIPLFVLAAAQDDSSSADSLTTGETFTKTITVNNNGNIYTKTRVDVYTGQATTDPTSGTATTVITVSATDATYTKTLVVTYSKTTTFPKEATESKSSDTDTSDDITTTLTISQQYETYTKTLTGDEDDFYSTSMSTNGVGAVGASLGVLGAAVLCLL